MTGTITRIFLPRGFAFVRGDDGQDYLLHANELRDAAWSGEVVREGVRVEFVARANGNSGNKLRATEVTLC
jgi:cold shock CspA family protein